MSQTSSAGQSLAYTYFNTGRLATMVDNAGTPSGYSSANVDSSYTYDADGNRTYERMQGTKFDDRSYARELSPPILPC